MSHNAAYWLRQIRSLRLTRQTRIMNVCGGHERAITMAGLRGVLPSAIELIPGPGCPVCVCPEEDVYQAIQLALQEKIILVAFGDMLRVPVNAPKGEARTLEQARTAGADIRPIASPQEAIAVARAAPNEHVVFFAAGFETTMAPVAAMVAAGIPENLSLLLSGRLTWPAVAMLLASDTPGFHGLVAPGHVSTVMGAQEWEFVPRQYQIPTAVAGFTAESLLAAFYSILRQLDSGKVFLDNCYGTVVSDTGNIRAQKILRDVFSVTDANWRGVGIIPASGFALQAAYRAHDARALFPQILDHTQRKHAGSMPPGCDCARVVLGRIYPNACRLYGRACTPRSPIGPCMVSEEGACRIWWSGGLRAPNTSMVSV